MRRAQAKLGTGDSSTHIAALEETGIHPQALPSSPLSLGTLHISAGTQPKPGSKLGEHIPCWGCEMGSCHCRKGCRWAWGKLPQEFSHWLQSHTDPLV